MPWKPSLAGAGLALWCGCASTMTPEGVATRYAEALRDGRLDAAYQLLDEGTRPDLATFRARYATGQERLKHSEAILASLGTLRARAGEVELLRSGAGWRVADPPPETAARQALERFLDAASGGDFRAAYLLLASTWRARYTPERLERDFRLEPRARERLARARAALSSPLVLSADEARLPLGEGQAVHLVRESGEYRIAALE